MKRKVFDLPVAFRYYEVRMREKQPKAPDGELVQGFCDNNKKVIEVHNCGDPDVTRSTIWHEFIHAALHESGHVGARDNEALVEALATSIMRVRTEIPWL